MLVSALLAAALAVPQAQATPPRQSLTIQRVATPPRLEDFLTGDRREGVSADEFLQREPQDLTPATERTEAYVSYDDTNLYAVFVCHAVDPSRIRARMSRREQIFNDDFVGVFLDTFNDRQRAYSFSSRRSASSWTASSPRDRGDDFSFDTIWDIPRPAHQLRLRRAGWRFRSGACAFHQPPVRRRGGSRFMRGIPVEERERVLAGDDAAASAALPISSPISTGSKVCRRAATSS